jgi:plasmid stability protein
MATLTIKNLPDSLYKRLKAKAAEHRRSLNSEAILAVERAVTESEARDPEEILTTLRQGRSRLGVFLTDAALRGARSHGRA